MYRLLMKNTPLWLGRTVQSSRLQKLYNAPILSSRSTGSINLSVVPWHPHKEISIVRHLSTSNISRSQLEDPSISHQLPDLTPLPEPTVASEPDVQLLDLPPCPPNGGPEVFADYGLGGWDLPQHWVQSMLEFLHSQLGIYWIPTLMIATVTCRLIALPAYVHMRAFIARSNNVLPQQLQLQLELQQSQGFEKQKKAAEFMDFLKEKNIHPLKPLLFQLPTMITFMSFFAALRGMSAAQLPSLQTGGILWFENLSIADPYYILPFMSCLTFHLLIRWGAATTEAGPAANIPQIKKILLWSPFLMLPFFIYQPASMFIFWMTSNMFTLCQMTIFLNPKVQRYFNIPPMIKHPDSIHRQMNPFEMVRKRKEQQLAAERAKRKVQEHMRQLQQFSKDNKKTD